MIGAKPGMSCIWSMGLGKAIPCKVVEVDRYGGVKIYMQKRKQTTWVGTVELYPAKEE